MAVRDTILNRAAVLKWVTVHLAALAANTAIHPHALHAEMQFFASRQLHLFLHDDVVMSRVAKASVTFDVLHGSV
jgi:hypothetical protein